jgi:hypothetical protein
MFMDVVHAHASDNTIDGLNKFDGSFGGHLFHGGAVQAEFSLPIACKRLVATLELLIK